MSEAQEKSDKEKSTYGQIEIGKQSFPLDKRKILVDSVHGNVKGRIHGNVEGTVRTVHGKIDLIIEPPSTFQQPGEDSNLQEIRVGERDIFGRLFGPPPLSDELEKLRLKSVSGDILLIVKDPDVSVVIPKVNQAPGLSPTIDGKPPKNPLREIEASTEHGRILVQYRNSQPTPTPTPA